MINQDLVVSSEKAIQLLMNGSVGVLPTDTVYGLTARAHNQAAVQRLYALKHREHKPGTLVAASVEQLHDLGVSKDTIAHIGSLWPNPLSIVLPVANDFSYLHQEVGDIAIRIVADPTFAHILKQTGPLLTSSANQPGEPTSTTIEEAWNYFGDSVDFYVNGGDLSGQPPSTIVRLTPSGTFEIIRQGATTLPK